MKHDELWSPIIFFKPTASDNTIAALENAGASAAEEDSGFNLAYFMSDDAKIKGDEAAIDREIKKQERKSRKTQQPTSVIVGRNQQIDGSTEVPYISTYEETNNMIRATIAQADMLSAEIKGDIDSIRANKSLKGKYTYLTNLNSAAASLISAKLGAIKELNSSITQSHNLELKRSKDLKEAAADKKNDDARMMDLYSAFINAPMGMYDNKLNMPTVPDMMLGVNDPMSGISGISMVGGGIGTPAQNITPEQLRMRMESNPNIEEVVMYDPSTGNKWFEVIDRGTGQIVPNFPKSDPFLLEDVSVETRAGVAKNRNLDRVWPLQVVGGVNMSEY